MTQHCHIYGQHPTKRYGADTVWLTFADAQHDFIIKNRTHWGRLQFDVCHQADCLTDPHYEHPYQKTDHWQA